MYSNETIFLLIGRITVYFSTLDFLVSQLIYKAIKKDIKHNLKNNSTLGQKLRLLNGLSSDSFYSYETYIEIHKVINKVIKVSEERNRYIHDMWIFNPKDVSTGIIKRCRLEGTNELTTKFSRNEFVSIQQIIEFEQELLLCQRIIGNLIDEGNNSIEHIHDSH